MLVYINFIFLIKMNENILLKLNNQDLQYFKNYIHYLNKKINIDNFIGDCERTSNKNIITKIKTLLWSDNKIYDYNEPFLNLQHFEPMILSPNFKFSYRNYYLKFIGLVSPGKNIKINDFKRFYWKELRELIQDKVLLESEVLKDHLERLTSALEYWQKFVLIEEKNIEDLNWNLINGELKLLFGLPISKNNTKDLNEFLLRGFIEIESENLED